MTKNTHLEILMQSLYVFQNACLYSPNHYDRYGKYRIWRNLIFYCWKMFFIILKWTIFVGQPLSYSWNWCIQCIYCSNKLCLGIKVNTALLETLKIKHLHLPTAAEIYFLSERSAISVNINMLMWFLKKSVKCQIFI